MPTRHELGARTAWHTAEVNRTDTPLQIENLRERITLLRHTQATGVLSLLFCTGSLFALFLDEEFLARISFGGSLLLMLGSLGLSLWEIQLSVRAIHIELDSLSDSAAPMQAGTP
ncbi:MAG: DUF2721 domain-containing protein [Panacagrimonas sp.]